MLHVISSYSFSIHVELKFTNFSFSFNRSCQLSSQFLFHIRNTDKNADENALISVNNSSIFVIVFYMTMINAEFSPLSPSF